MLRKLKAKWIRDCKKVLDKKGFYQLDELNIFQLWNNARISRKLYKKFMER